MKKNKEKKLGTLRKNVLRPLLITISALSIAILIFFNAVMMLLLYTETVSDLKSTAEILQSESSDSPSGTDEISEVFLSEIKRRNPVCDLFLLFEKGGKITKNSVSINGEEKNNLLQALEDIKNKGSVTYVKIQSDMLLICPLQATAQDGENAYICASLRSLGSIIRLVNEILLIIICISAIAMVIASHIIADNIAKPISELSNHMEVIGDGDFSPVTVDKSCVELNKLTISINDTLTKLRAYNNAHTISLQNLSHDLRTPLMSIQGYAEGIKYGIIENSDMATDVIINESKKLTAVVEKILILSELDTLNQPINMLPVKLYDFTDDEIERIDGYALSENVKISLVADDENVSVLADNQLLSTIIQNLLSNAIRYAESKVEVKIINGDSGAKLTVTDDGAGMSEEDLQHIFTRNYVGKTGHTGLGLSASKSAAEYMGCSIKGENSENGGAVFTVSFPKFI